MAVVKLKVNHSAESVKGAREQNTSGADVQQCLSIFYSDSAGQPSVSQHTHTYISWIPSPAVDCRSGDPSQFHFLGEIQPGRQGGCATDCWPASSTTTHYRQ